MKSLDNTVRGTNPETEVLEVAADRRRWRIPLSSLRFTASERRWLLAIFDVLALNSALLVALALRYDYRLSWATLFEAPIYFVLLTILWLVWASFFDCYDLVQSADGSRSAWSTGRAALLTALTYLAIPFYTPHFPASRLSAYLFIGLATISAPLWRLIYASIFSQPTFQQRLLIVGAGHSGSELARELAAAPHYGNPYAGSGYRVVGFVDDDPAKAGTEVAGVPVLGNRRDLTDLISEHDVDILVTAITHTPEIHPGLFRAILDCRERGIRVEPMSSLYERMTGKVPVEHAGTNLHVVLPLSDAPMQRVFWAAKRLFDLLTSVLGLLVLGLALSWIALANAIWSPGPLLYWQTRVGKGGRTFTLVKLRTMVPNAEQDSGAVWSTEEDERVTAVGRFLRRSRLDELPQCWNILRGEMSLIGPRPERPEIVAQLVRQVPFYQARHAVRPGITGWAQVRYHYGSSVNDALVKLQYDLYYIKHQSVYLELSILVKTAAVILGLRGR
ncbi:MAG: sugar transferase [Anaerolineae bacterium]|jgi:exopolysaccharide biosynthesis polyprenyl glycosylphosphotransferase